MKIVFRTDASSIIGGGHLARCLALASALQLKGAQIFFVCRQQVHDHLFHAVSLAGYRLLFLPHIDAPLADGCYESLWPEEWQDVDSEQTLGLLKDEGPIDWIVIDHYGLGSRWEGRVRAHTTYVMVIDDLANRTHNCDLLLDHNFSCESASRYDHLVPKKCTTLLGPQFAILRPEFEAIRKTNLRKDGSLFRALIFFGAGDRSNETKKTLQAFRQLNRENLEITAIVTESNANYEQIAAICNSMSNVALYKQTAHMAELMAESDLMIGSGGGAMLESCCVGLPSIVLSTAKNQEAGSAAAGNAGAVLYLGSAANITVDSLTKVLHAVLMSPWLLKHMSNACKTHVIGDGARIVAAHLLAHRATLALRVANKNDCENIYSWRNTEETRRFSSNSHLLSFDMHKAWFSKVLSSNDQALLIGEVDNIPVGVLRYDRNGDRATVSIYLVPGNSGRGIGAQLLDCGTEWVQKQWTSVKLLEATIRKDNCASIKAFRRAGFYNQFEVFLKELSRQ